MLQANRAGHPLITTSPSLPGRFSTALLSAMTQSSRWCLAAWRKEQGWGRSAPVSPWEVMSSGIWPSLSLCYAQGLPVCFGKKAFALNVVEQGWCSAVLHPCSTTQSQGIRAVTQMDLGEISIQLHPAPLQPNLQH